MIQILGLREYINKKTGKPAKAERFFEKLWRVKSVAELFRNIEKYVAPIPEEERWNIYFTVAHCFEEKGRNKT